MKGFDLSISYCPEEDRLYVSELDSFTVRYFAENIEDIISCLRDYIEDYSDEEENNDQ